MVKSIFKSIEGKNKILKEYKNFLDKWPVEKETVYVETEYGKTHVIVSGKQNSKSLFMLHGSASNALIWSSYVKYLSKTHKVYAIDIPGEPGMSEENQFDLCSEAPIKWINNIKDSFNIKNFSLLGNSLGSYISLKYAIYEVGSVEKIALISTSGIGPQNNKFLFYMIPIMFLGNYGIKKILNKINYKVKLPEEAYDYSFLISKHFNPRMVNLKLFSDDELKLLKIPVYIIMGEKDIMINSKISYERAKNNIENVKLDYLMDTGHVIIDKEEEIFNFFN